MKKDKNENYMTHRTPADMHGDGVYFNEDLLAKKRQKELQKQKTEKTNNKS